MNVDTDGQKSINYYINVMQNIVGNIPHSSDTFKGSGCTFATMTGIINDYRAKNNMPAINWQQKLDNKNLDKYFISANDVADSKGTLTDDNIGELKRDSFLKDFTDNKLVIIEDTRKSGNSAEDTAKDAINSEKDYYIVGRSKIKTSAGKSEHETGITDIENNKVSVIKSSNYDSGRDYYTDGSTKQTIGNENGRGVLSRTIVIGEKE